MNEKTGQKLIEYGGYLVFSLIAVLIFYLISGGDFPDLFNKEDKLLKPNMCFCPAGGEYICVERKCVTIKSPTPTPIPQSIDDKEYWKKRAEIKRVATEKREKWIAFCGGVWNIEYKLTTSDEDEYYCIDASKIPPENLE